MIVLLAAALAVACVALVDALRNAAVQRRRADTAELLRDALSAEVGRLRSRERAAAPTPAAPPIADFVALLHKQPLPPLLLKRPLAPGEEPAGFAVRWGLA